MDHPNPTQGILTGIQLDQYRNPTGHVQDFDKSYVCVFYLRHGMFGPVPFGVCEFRLSRDALVVVHQNYWKVDQDRN